MRMTKEFENKNVQKSRKISIFPGTTMEAVGTNSFL